ncbi:MAG: DNA topoisomerase 4 subunit A [Microbacteriaceae bacterium]|nr:DNA topoisomerase 4 subunit A [Microbacteriaceae bacterium]
MTAPITPPKTADSERIVDVELTDEMEGSFLEYAYSVIYSRALPDARDGLKPVQRRIIYQMSQMGLTPQKGHVKSARVVGDVMGKLHPHGDSAIYDALVRMAQSWSMRIPMVDGHGNFGSLDDGPAAARYTEARLRPEALAMVQDLDEDVVDFIPNYDNQLTQPSVLPAAIPHLLVNGASGIAVGMATNMAPHNLVEVIAAAQYVLNHPEASVEDLQKIIPGPDLPSGGTIIGTEGISDAYLSGRGSFKTRATVSIENIGPRKTGLVVTELPYLVGPERVIDKIKDAVGSKKLTGISDVTDLTDRHHGLRLVIGIKGGFDPEAVLSELYRLTPLEENFSINSVALVEGQPKTLGLRELLQVYLDHRILVVTRRSRFRLTQRTARLHLVEGLLVAITDIDEVIQVIRASDDGSKAKERLREVFDLSDEQAEYILELRLRRLTKFSRLELETERDSLAEDITKLTALLASEERIRETVSTELSEMSEKYGTPRRSVISGHTPAVAPRSSAPQKDLAITDIPCTVVVSALGRASRFAPSNGALVLTDKRSAHDAVMAHIVTSTRGRLGAITSAGMLHTFHPSDLPELSSSKPQWGQGIALSEYLGLSREDGEILGVIALGSDVPFMLGTAAGVVKRVSLADLGDKTLQSVMTLKDGDRVVGCGSAPDSHSLVLITSAGQLLNFSSGDVRPQGLAASGVAGISLPNDARVIFAGAVDRSVAQVVTVSGSSQVLPGTESARAKRTPLVDFPTKGRATSGVRAHAFLKGEDILSRAFAGVSPLAMGAKGQAIALPEEVSKRDGSGTLLEGSITAFGESLS